MQKKERFIGIQELIKVEFSPFSEVKEGFPEEVTFLRMEGYLDASRQQREERTCGK